MDLTGETPICATKDLKQPLAFPKEYGTISEFYFLLGQMIHFGLLHMFRKVTDIRKLIDRLEEEKKLNPSDANI